ncbi:MAG: hypothetical protein PHX84_03500 [Candidatus Shapirobacteria bacterium]|jgi:hypothetical protein|nr:hypothetical protein [Candidatus Shapirobacteria bacterium]
MNLFKNEKTLPVLVVVASSLLVGVIVLYGYNTGKISWLKNGNNKQVTTQTEKEKNKQASYIEVARKTLDWIDKQRNKDGWYITERGCELAEKSCNMIFDSEKGNINGLIATWARLNFYEQQKEVKDLEIVKKDIDIFYDKYKDDDLKDSLWICKITYEMAQSKYIETDQKNKLREICADYNPVNINLINSKIQNQNFLQNSNNSTQNTLLNIFDSDFGTLSNLVFHYLWLKQNEDIGLVENYYDSFLKIINGNYANLKSVDDACLVLFSVFDKYNLNNDKNMLNQIGEWRIKLNDKYRDNKGSSSLVCGLLDQKLYEVSGNNIFLENLQNTRNTIMDDIDTNYGDGFFVFSQKYQNILIKDVVENSLVVKIMGDS